MAADEVLVQVLAGTLGLVEPIVVTLKSETYPDTKNFTYRRFSVQGNQQDISLLLKKAQTVPETRQSLSLLKKLHNEANFYSQAVPKIRPILEKMNETETTAHKLFIPNYYGHDMTEGKEWLAIEDISTDYKSVPDPENLDKEHLKTIVPDDPSKNTLNVEAEILIRVGQREGLSYPIEVILKGEYPTTGSYSTISRFVVKGACNRKLCVVLKTAVKNPETRKRNFVTRKFRNEETFYDHIRNRLLFENRSLSSESVSARVAKDVKLLKAKQSRFPKIPKVYDSALTEGNEYILLEDLEDYYPFPDPQNLDSKHLKASVQALAAFHSASIAWKTSNPFEYHAVASLFCETEMMRPDDADPTIDLKTQKMNAALGAAARASSLHLTGPYSISVEKVCHSANFEAPFWVSMERSEPWSVITHGDCWAKNFLYKYDKNKKITGVAILDFKCSRAGSPVLDVCNFLLSSASPECLRDLRPFLEKHKDSMSPKIPDYRSHVRQFGPYGFVAALVHHYYSVLYPKLDTSSATRLIENPEQAEAYEEEVAKAAKKSAGSAGGNRSQSPHEIPPREKRAALVIKAAHDVRII